MNSPAASGTVKSYTLGALASLCLTLAAYAAVTQQVFSGWSLIAFLVATAVVQLFVQLRFFLHLGHGTDTKWNLIAFAAMATVVATVVIGSLWIMANLHYQGARPTDNAVMHDEGITR